MTNRHKKAIQIVEQIEREVTSITKWGTGSTIQFPASKDDMVPFFERLLDTKAKFKEQGYSTHVDIGFHYTSTHNIKGIRLNGLMSRLELESNQIKYCGSAYGEGIYTGNNPESFESYGRVGLIVARLKGNTTRLPRQKCCPINIMKKFIFRSYFNNATTFIGNRTEDPSNDQVVLRSSSQCVVLVQYDNFHDKGCGNYFDRRFNTVYDVHDKIQAILDEHLNGEQNEKVSSPEVLVVGTNIVKQGGNKKRLGKKKTNESIVSLWNRVVPPLKKRINRPLQPASSTITAMMKSSNSH